MFKNLRLGLKIAIGFSVVLALLSIVLGISINALHKAENGIAQYRELARDTNVAGRLQANMLMVRMNVKDYLITQSEQDLSQYSDFLERMHNFLESAKQGIHQPERAALIKDVDSAIIQYQQGFDKVVTLINKRNQILEEVLTPNGEDMSGAISDIVEFSFDEETNEAAYYATLVQERMLLGRMFVTKYLQTHSETDFVVAIKSLDTAVNHQVEDLDKHLFDDELREYLEEFQNARAQYIEGLHTMNTLILEQNEVIEGTLNQIGPEIANNVEKVKLSVMGEQDTLGPDLKKSTNTSINLTLTLSLVAIVLGIIAAYLLTVSITRPIHKAVDAAHQLANGDLTVDIGETSGDETGVLLSAMENTASNLKTMISTISGASMELASASEKLAHVTVQTSKGITQQEAETDMVATAMNEMSVTVHDVADNATKAAEAANLADAQAKMGADVVDETISSINTLSDNVNESSQKLSEVEREVANISTILDVIREIADQTNLLALNAAIEAARAGTHGRGFAVVADEVRSLAGKTQGSTQEIQNIIEQLQTGTKTTVDAINQGQEQAASCVEQATEAGVALSAITDAIGVINDMNMQIARASEQQSSVAESISENVVNVKRIAEENATASDQTSNSSAEIASLAEQLNELVAQFKVS